MPGKYQFEVLSGSYQDIRGWAPVATEEGGEPVPVRVYRKGDIVESDQELDVKFKNKFRRLSGPTKMPRDHIPGTESSGISNMDKPDFKRVAALKKHKAEGAAQKAKPPINPQQQIPADLETRMTSGKLEGEPLDEDEIQEAEEESGEEEKAARAAAELDEEGEGLLGDTEEGEEVEEEDVSDDFEPPAGVTVHKIGDGFMLRKGDKDMFAKPLPTDRHVKLHIQRLKAAKAPAKRPTAKRK